MSWRLRKGGGFHRAAALAWALTCLVPGSSKGQSTPTQPTRGGSPAVEAGRNALSVDVGALSGSRLMVGRLVEEAGRDAFNVAVVPVVVRFAWKW